MLERHGEENPQRRIDLMVEAALDRACGVVARQRIGGVGMAAAAKHVARDLVEQNRQRQRALRRSHPVLEFAACGAVVRRQPLLAAARVEFLIAREPALVAGLLPEGEDVVWGDLHGYTDSSANCVSSSLIHNSVTLSSVTAWISGRIDPPEYDCETKRA